MILENKKIFKNISWLFFDNIVKFGVSFFIGVWVVRYLGPTGYGKFVYALSFAGFFEVVASLGLKAIVVRELIKKNANQSEILFTAFIFQLVSSCAIILFCNAINLFANSSDGELQLIIFLFSIAFLFKTFNVITYLYESQLNSKYIVITSNIVIVISSLIKVTLIFLHFSVVWFAIVTLFEAMLSAAIYLFIYWRHYSKPQFLFNFPLGKQMLIDSTPLILTGIIIMGYMRVDQLIIGNLLGIEKAGIYAAAIKISELWYFIPMIIQPTLFPFIMKAKEENDDVYYKTLYKSYSVFTIIAYTVCISVTLLSPWIIGVCFGKAYSEASGILSITVWSGLFVSLGLARNSFTVAENENKSRAILAFSSIAINLGLNFILIPIYQLKGAAVANVITYLCEGYLLGFLFKRFWRNNVMITKSLIKPNPF